MGHIVVRQFFALQLLGRGDAGVVGIGFGVEGRFLVRVFAVAHVLGFLELRVEGAREMFGAAGDHTAKVVGDGAVIGSGVLVGFDSQIKAGLLTGVTVVLVLFIENARVVCGIVHYVHITVVFL